MHRRKLTTVFLILSFIITPGATACDNAHPSSDHRRINATKACLPLFQDNPVSFDYCKNQICFLFLKQPPFVKTPEAFNFSNIHKYQRRFICGDHIKLHRELTGTVFDVFRGLQEKGQKYTCLWAGDESHCTFNALVDFVDLHAERGYQFAISNMLVEIPIRHCRHTMGVSLMDEKIVIVGHAMNPGEATTLAAFLSLLSPFHYQTWILFVAVLALIVILSASIVRFILPDKSASLRDAILLLAGLDPSEGHRNGICRTRPIDFRIISLLLRFSVLSLFGICLLFYEIGVVNSLFQNRDATLGKPITDLKEKELVNYCTLHNSASERVWKYACKFRHLSCMSPTCELLSMCECLLTRFSYCGFTSRK